MLTLKNLTKIYHPGTVNEMTLFRNFNLTIHDGEFVTVVGSNGSGKTSLLNIICGSIPLEGRLHFFRRTRDHQNARLQTHEADRPSLPRSRHGNLRKSLNLREFRFGG